MYLSCLKFYHIGVCPVKAKQTLWYIGKGPQSMSYGPFLFFALQSISLEEDVVLCGHSECHVTTRCLALTSPTLDFWLKFLNHMLTVDSARATSLLQGVHLSLKANIINANKTKQNILLPHCVIISCY